LAAGIKEEEHTSGTEYLLMFLSVAAAVAGWGLAWKAYRDADKGYVEPIAASAPPIYDVLYNKYYVDELYAILFVKPVVEGSTAILWQGVDQQLSRQEPQSHPPG
jgi:NADH-quinone oxidoreductase subunit L